MTSLRFVKEGHHAKAQSSQRKMGKRKNRGDYQVSVRPISSASSAPPRLCVRPSRRAFLSDVGMGFAGVALGAMLAKEGVLKAADEVAAPQSKPKAKNVIWIFLVGGMSHMESFDPKPALNEHAGKTIAESPYKAVLDSPYLKRNLKEFVPGHHKVQPSIYPLQVGFGKRGQSGIAMSDWFPHLGRH